MILIDKNERSKNDQSNQDVHYLGSLGCQDPKNPQTYPQFLWRTVGKSKR